MRENVGEVRVETREHQVHDEPTGQQRAAAGDARASRAGGKLRANKRPSETPPSIPKSPDGIAVVLFCVFRSPLGVSRTAIPSDRDYMLRPADRLLVQR